MPDGWIGRGQPIACLPRSLNPRRFFPLGLCEEPCLLRQKHRYSALESSRKGRCDYHNPQHATNLRRGQKYNLDICLSTRGDHIETC